MGTLIVSLLPFIIGSTVVPIQIIINVLLLQNPQHGLLKSVAYIGGMTLLRLLQGLIFIPLLSKSTADASGANGQKGLVVSILLLVLGIFLLITAFKKWRKEKDPDDPPPQWLTTIENLSPLKAFGIGFGILALGPKFWVFTLGAVGIIDEARLGLVPTTVTYLLFVVLAQTSVLLPLLIRIILPKSSQSLLQKFSAWLTHYERVIVVTVSLIFGLFFLYQGVSGLLQ